MSRNRFSVLPVVGNGSTQAERLRGLPGGWSGDVRIKQREQALRALLSVIGKPLPVQSPKLHFPQTA